MEGTNNYMIFDQEAINNKIKYLDKILQNTELVNEVVNKHLSKPYEIYKLDRVWEPGGGSTLFKIATAYKEYLLKVKHKSVWVESRLEKEKEFTRKSSLLNEYEFINYISTEWVPEILFYEEANDFCFLALEYLQTFNKLINKISVVELLDVWREIYDNVYYLYLQGIVHTDIHEHNICFRNKKPILIDFEEAKFIAQKMDFKDSLDYIGQNQIGNVGEFPSGFGIEGFTCLSRLKNVFKLLVTNSLPQLIEECNFDHSCPFNKDELQHPDQRIYQSINLPGIYVEGQRPIRDSRKLIVRYLICLLGRHISPINYLDIGCNLGMFCFQAAVSPIVRRSIGVEAHSKYVDLANILMFLNDIPNTDILQFICGEDRLDELDSKIDFITMLSVYHHISQKEKLLKEIKILNVQYLLGEFATQDRYYPERGSLNDEINFIQNKTGFKFCYLITKSKDYNRPIYLFSNSYVSVIKRLFIKILSSRFYFLGTPFLVIAEKWSNVKYRRNEK
ncbi:protein kinase domain-containing protein [Phosphitispora sp. TUW77]|uniref:protein kinase domain-containing protein n=1 Tax=Phosphitispora sp. TUW77 TaxID=3152361 RepID=UPI003AB70260